MLFDGISELAARYRPDVAAVEIVFVNVNPQSTLLPGRWPGTRCCKWPGGMRAAREQRFHDKTGQMRR